MLIGSNSGKVPARVADYADGWMPIYGRYQGDPIDDLKAACDACGRAFEEMTVVLFDAPRDAQVIDDFVTRGCRDFVFFPTRRLTSPTLAWFDDLARFIEDLPRS